MPPLTHRYYFLLSLFNPFSATGITHHVWIFKVLSTLSWILDWKHSWGVLMNYIRVSWEGIKEKSEGGREAGYLAGRYLNSSVSFIAEKGKKGVRLKMKMADSRDGR